MERGLRWAPVFLFTACLGLMGATIVGAAEVAYDARFVEHAGGHVQLTVLTADDGRPKLVRLGFRGLTLQCDDGRIRHARAPEHLYRLNKGPRGFSRTVRGSNNKGDLDIATTRGRIGPGLRASGTVEWTEHKAIDEDNPTAYNCSTDGRVHWKAHLRRD
jgi:hypothetical protein